MSPIKMRKTSTILVRVGDAFFLLFQKLSRGSLFSRDFLADGVMILSVRVFEFASAHDVTCVTPEIIRILKHNILSFISGERESPSPVFEALICQPPATLIIVVRWKCHTNIVRHGIGMEIKYPESSSKMGI